MLTSNGIQSSLIKGAWMVIGYLLIIYLTLTTCFRLREPTRELEQVVLVVVVVVVVCGSDVRGYRYGGSDDGGNGDSYCGGGVSGNIDGGNHHDRY